MTADAAEPPAEERFTSAQKKTTASERWLFVWRDAGLARISHKR
jgi:hypothetical protein